MTGGTYPQTDANLLFCLFLLLKKCQNQESEVKYCRGQQSYYKGSSQIKIKKTITFGKSPQSLVTPLPPNEIGNNDKLGTKQGLARLRLESRERDWYLLISSLVVETETETMTP